MNVKMSKTVVGKPPSDVVKEAVLQTIQKLQKEGDGCVVVDRNINQPVYQHFETADNLLQHIANCIENDDCRVDEKSNSICISADLEVPYGLLNCSVEYGRRPQQKWIAVLWVTAAKDTGKTLVVVR